MPTITRAWLVDSAERVVSSFLEAVVALVVAGGISSLNASTVHVLLAAGLTAAGATVKTILAGMKANTLTPASLAPKKKRRAHDAGYGLIELLIVVLIVAVILAVLIPAIR